MMVDAIEHKVYQNDDLTLPALRKGKVDVILSKYDLLQWLITFATSNFKPDVSEVVRDITKSTQSWRAKMGAGKATSVGTKI